jgi:hypothetical protein
VQHIGNVLVVFRENPEAPAATGTPSEAPDTRATKRSLQGHE